MHNLRVIHSSKDRSETIYSGSSADLEALGAVCWKHNRPADMDRVAEIAEAIERTGVVDGVIYLVSQAGQAWPGPCTGVTGRTSGPGSASGVFSPMATSMPAMFCYDGNHRRLALRSLPDKRYMVLISILHGSASGGATDERVKEKFALLNKACPVPEIYHTVDPAERLAVLTTVVDELCVQFRKFRSTCARPRRPNFNRDALLQQLDQKFTDVELPSSSELLERIYALNAAYKSGLHIDLHTIPPSIKSKCDEHDCYLFVRDFTLDL